MRYRIGVDIGGTFTDCVVADERGGRTVSKAPTTPGSLQDGVLEAVTVNADQLGLTRPQLLAATDLFVHGTTQATNAMLTRTGARTGLITTKGHEDAIIIGKVYAKVAGLPERDLVHSSRLRKPDPIVPRSLIRGVTERIDRDGDVIVELQENEVIAAIDSLLEAGVEAIAVSLLWSFVNDSHERRIKELLSERAGDVFTAYSHEVAPVLGEYERTATTAITAYVGPKVVGYLEELETQLREEGLTQPLLVMQASGGLTSVLDAAQRPIVTLDSGPTGGILGCQHLGRLYGEQNVICTDVGGTSFDVGLILRGEVPLEVEPVVAQYSLRMPKVLVHSIGSGGGSIAWLDEGGLLRVGPQSAGSRPGPACYGQGGVEPTVTDADLVLGYLDADNFLGGRMRLDRDLAVRALAALGARLGMEPEEVAVGVFRIINSQMADLIRKSTIEQGHDPRECVLVAYGGAGPTHAIFYGHEIGSKAILVLADSTVFSAEGMLTCDITHTAEVSRARSMPFDEPALAALTSRFEALEQRVMEQFDREGAPRQEVSLARTIGVRFRQQVHTVEVDVDPGALDAAAGERILERFIERYGQVYGEGALLLGGGNEVELHRVVGTRPIEPVAFPTHDDAGPDAGAALKGERDAYFEPHGYTPTTIYDGDRLQAGNHIDGPAIIERMGDNVVVPPGFDATVDPLMTIRRGIRDRGADRRSRRCEDRRGERVVAVAEPMPTLAGLDPVTFEVIRHRLWAINDDQGRMAARLSGSFIVFEGYDFNAALVTADGRGLYCGMYILHHGATIDEFVRGVLAGWPADEIREGDMFFTNDPWWGALHANDGILAMPIFWEGRLVAWSGIAMHDEDVGSPVPGSFVQGAHDRFGEAPLIPAVKMVTGFAPRRDLLRAYLRNSRTSELNALNMRARVAALRTTYERIQELIGQYGLDAFLAAQDGILEYVARVVRSRLREIPDGSWFGQIYHDHDGTNDEIYRLCCRVGKHADQLTIDLRGTSPQAPGPINCARPAMEGAVLGVILTFLCYDLPWAIGALRDIVEIISQPGTINNARDPAAVSMASVMGTLSTQDVVSHAFAKMLLASERYRSEAQASWSPGFGGGLFIAQNPNGEAWIGQLTDAFAGAAGARTFADGIDSGGIFHSMGSRMSNAETVEARVPALQLWRREMRDGAGAGRFRGGAAVEFGSIPHKLPIDPGVCSTFAAGVHVPIGRGLSGGHPGGATSNVILRGANARELFAAGRLPSHLDELNATSVEVQLPKMLSTLGEGDFLLGVQASGAGYGDPLRRDPALVARDVGEGLVSEEFARALYGVVVHDGAPDLAATEHERERLRRARLEGASYRTGTTIERAALLHPVCDTIDAVEVGSERRLRCSVCHRDLGGYGDNPKRAAVMRELALDALSPHNARCLPEYVLREYCCPGCATAFASDVAHRDEPLLDEVSLSA